MKKFKNDMAFKETKTFQLYLYSIFFSELFSFEKINSWLWREKKQLLLDDSTLKEDYVLIFTLLWGVVG